MVAMSLFARLIRDSEDDQLQPHPEPVPKQRVVVHWDADSFHCQVYEQLSRYKHLKGSAYFVSNSSGMIVSVSEHAKLLGIGKTKKTGLCANQVLKRHSGVKAIWIEERNGKPDDMLARMAKLAIRGSARQFQRSHPGILLEFPLKDEFFMELTNYNWPAASETNWTKLDADKTFVEGIKMYNGRNLKVPIKIINSNRRVDPRSNEREYCLLQGAVLAQKVIKWIEVDTGFKLSAGVAENKLLAKLATGLHKPSGITVLTFDGLTRLANTIPIENISGLGGDKGAKIKKDCGFGRKNQIMTIQDLRDRVCKPWFRKQQSSSNTKWLKDVLWGRCSEAVSQIVLDEKMSTGKTFRSGLQGGVEILKFINQLMVDFLEKSKIQSLQVEKRLASTISFQIAYISPGQRGIKRKTVAVESPLFQYDDRECASRISKQVAHEMETQGVELDVIKVKEMKFFTKFKKEDFIDLEDRKKIWRAIRERERSGFSDSDSSDFDFLESDSDLEF